MCVLCMHSIAHMRVCIVVTPVMFLYDNTVDPMCISHNTSMC